MLVTEELRNTIESAIHSAMKDALLETLKFDINKPMTPEEMAEKFGATAGKCADSIANAIEKYVQGASILLPAGTTIPLAPGLICPVGPVTGSVVTFGPVIIDGSIK